jgi:hypothetical protein
MKKPLLLGLMLILAIAVAGCHGDDSPGTFIAQSFSDQDADGDVSFNPATSTYTSTTASSTGTVIYGINDPVPGVNSVEYRGFLDFPLNGAVGGDVLPLSATIVSADIELFISRVDFATTVPTLLDLVTYNPVTGPLAADYTNPSPLAFRSLDIFSSDAGNFVRIDVTPLMREAQTLGLRNFQLRFLLDFIPGAAGLVTISDSGTNAPLLTVEYR